MGAEASTVEKEVEDNELNGNGSDIPFQNTDVSKLKIKGIDDDFGSSNVDDEKEKGKEGEGEGDEAGKEKEGEGEGKEKGEESAEGKEKGAEASGAGKETAADKKEYTQQEFESSVNNIISKVSGNTIKSLADLPKVLADNVRLKKELENKEPVFANEREKLLFDHSKKAAGFELQAGRQYFHVMSLGDVKDLGDKDAQFESFHLTRPDLSRDKALKIFEADYNERFTDLENNIVQQDKHAVATREAKEKLVKMQEDFNKAEAKAKDESIDPKKTEAIHKSIDDSLEGFEGMHIPFGDADEDKLSMKLTEEEVSEFKSFLKEPIKIIENVIERCTDEHGNLNVDAYNYEMFTIFKRHELAEEANKLGITQGQLRHIKGAKNTKDSKEKDGKEAKPKLSFEETMVNAVAGRKN